MEECLHRQWWRVEEEEEEEETNNGVAKGEDNDGERRVADQLAGSHTVAEEGGRRSRGKKKSQLLGANVLNK